MTGLFDFLPFIEGWDYHAYTIPYHVILPGNPVQRLKIQKRGWLLQAAFATTDAFGTIETNVQGPGESITKLTVLPESALLLGAVQYDPAGYLQMYFRPNPLITNGFYFLSIMSPGFTGTPFPFVKEITVNTYLSVGSTQAAAFLTAGCLLIEIKDEKTFFKSLRNLGILPYTSALGTPLTSTAEKEDISKTLKDILEELKGLRKGGS